MNYTRMIIVLAVFVALMAVSGQAPPGEGATSEWDSPAKSAERLPGLDCLWPDVMGDIAGRHTVISDPRTDINSIDALWILQRVAGLHLPLPGCSPEDMDCDGDRDAVDARWILRWIAYLPVYQNEPCPDIGTELH